MNDLEECRLSMNEKSVMEGALAALLSKKARNPCVIDISKVSTIARYFVIVSGTSTTHIKALADAVEDELGRSGRSPYRRAGYGSARWILLDFSEVIVHVFHDDERAFYGLERLWQDGEFLLPDAAGENGGNDQLQVRQPGSASATG
jgi:ribosome-associated protein